MTFTLKFIHQSLPLKQVFRIARGAKTAAEVMVVMLSDDQQLAWAEAVPYARYQETIESTTAQLQDFAITLSSITNFAQLHQAINQLPAGAARNALDCAYWDLAAKQQHSSVTKLAQLPPSQPCLCAQTLSIDSPEAMAAAVKAMGSPPLVKVKLDNQDIIGKMTAIYQAAPNSEFIVDANEGWTFDDLTRCIDKLKELNVVLIEQPLPASDDDQLSGFDSPIALCADESCHTSADLPRLVNRYHAVNIKLDKTGGLTEAIALAQRAQALGFDIMIGCMVGSSLAMAPASLLCPFAKYVDLDGPLIIATDRHYGLQFLSAHLHPLNGALWGDGQASKNEQLEQLWQQV